MKLQTVNKTMRELIRIGASTMGRHDTRQYLNAVRFRFDQDELRMSASDGVVLSDVKTSSIKWDTEYSLSPTSPEQIIVPCAHILLLQKMMSLSASDNPFYIEVKENEALFSVYMSPGFTTLKVPLINAKYPDVEAIHRYDLIREVNEGKVGGAILELDALVKAECESAILYWDADEAIKIGATADAPRDYCETQKGKNSPFLFNPSRMSKLLKIVPKNIMVKMTTEVYNDKADKACFTWQKFLSDGKPMNVKMVLCCLNW